MYHPYCIPLNKTTLLFLLPDQTSLGKPLVVQVTIKHAGESVMDELAEFYLFHHEITCAIENLICAHICRPLPSSVDIIGHNFILHATHKPWVYGKRIEVKWGDQPVVPAADKWTFVIHITRI